VWSLVTAAAAGAPKKPGGAFAKVSGVALLKTELQWCCRRPLWSLVRVAATSGSKACSARSSRTRDEPGPTTRRCISKVTNAPKFDVRTYLFRICGVDLTAIDGIDTRTALKIIVEIGPDLPRFKSAEHFASWLGLCPGTKISHSNAPNARQRSWSIGNRA